MDSVSTTKVFIPHENFIWVSGELIAEYGNGIVDVRIVDSELPKENDVKKIDLKQYFDGSSPSLPLHNTDISSEGVNDMCSLSYLHEPSILDNLRRRFFSRKPYTYTGEICVAVNPYQWLDLYSEKTREQYSRSYRHELPPHVYATSAAAYRGLVTRNLNQSILVSGESGAGKTETVKILMGHLAFISSQQGDRTVDKLLKANPLLESFGNAKTVRNDNSSRFGRFSQLEFDSLHQLAGSRCVTYLLEKSRVVGQSSGERSYHVLYELLAAPEAVRQPLHLGEFNLPQDYNYTAYGDTATEKIEGVRDADRYSQTMAALRLLGVVTAATLLFETLAAVLHLGQLEFLPATGAEDAATLSPTGRSPAHDDALRACCALLHVSEGFLCEALVSRVIEVEGKRLNVPLTPEQAASGRDALAKEIYARLFNWLVLVINFNTSSLANRQQQLAAAGAGMPVSRRRESLTRGPETGGASYTISLLDIFGFECFAVNRFEQLCINFANEKLQQKFAQDVFKTVQREYQEEGIGLEQVVFKDNADVLELVEGRQGVISLLTEECMLPRGAEANFLSKLVKQHAQHVAFSVPRLSRDQFCIQHYAGAVAYTVGGFLDRNKDTLAGNMAELAAGSSHALLSRLFAWPSLFQPTNAEAEAHTQAFLAGDHRQNRAFLLLEREDGAAPDPADLGSRPSLAEGSSGGASGGGRARASTRLSTNVSAALSGSSGRQSSPPTRGRRSTTVGGPNDAPGSVATSSFVMAETVSFKFQSQLGALMDSITATEVQYVRCIKPNPEKSSKVFTRALVVEQLRSGGMIAAVKISRAAYPNRMPYSEFLERYRYLQPAAWHREQRALISRAQRPADLDGYKEAVLLCKALLAALLPECRARMRVKHSSDAELCQCGHTKIYFSAVLLEQLEAARARKVHEHATRLQARYRAYCARCRYLKTLSQVLKVQTRMRGTLAQRRYKARIIPHRRGVKALVRLQSRLRGSVLRAWYLRLRNSLVLVQSLCCMRFQQRRYIVTRDFARIQTSISAQRAAFEASLQAERDRAQAELEARLEMEREKQRAAAEAELERVRVEAEAERERVRIEAERRQQERLLAEAKLEAEAVQEKERQAALLVELEKLHEAARVEAEARQQQLEEQLLASQKEARKLAEAAEEDRARQRLTQLRLAEQEQEVVRLKAEMLAQLKVKEDAMQRAQTEMEAEKVRLRLEKDAEIERVRLATVAQLKEKEEAMQRAQADIEAEKERLRLETEAETERVRLATVAQLKEKEEAMQRAQADMEAEKERLRLETEAETERVRLATVAQLKEIEEAMQRAQADMEAEKERLRLEAEAEKERVRLATEAQLKEKEEAMHRAQADMEAEKERLRLETEAETERVRLATVAQLKEKEEAMHRAQADMEAEKERLRLEAEAEKERVRLATEAQLKEKEEAMQRAQADMEAEKERLRLEAETEAERVRIAVLATQEEASRRSAAENRLRGVLDAYTASKQSTPQREEIVQRLPGLFARDPGRGDAPEDRAVKTLQTVFDLLSSPAKRVDGGRTRAATSASQRPPSAPGSPTRRLYARAVDTPEDMDAIPIELQGEEETEEASDEVEQMQQELLAMQRAKEVAMEMLAEFVNEHPSLLQPEETEPEDQEDTWREIDTYGDDSYSKQLERQLKTLLPQRRLGVQVARYLECGEGEGAFIEYEITFSIDLHRTTEPLLKAFSLPANGGAPPALTEAKVRSGSPINGKGHKHASRREQVTVVVRRRFSEFAALWARLKSMHAPVPRLPQKQWLPRVGQRWRRASFLGGRQGQLDIWLNQVLQTATALSTEGLQHLQEFLTPPLDATPLAAREGELKHLV